MLEEENIIFLISQPRSGSTLTQKLLSQHTKISSTSEPWILLHPFYALKDKGFVAEYNSTLAKKALNFFVGNLSLGEQTYRNEIKKMILNLYSDFIRNQNVEFFLDKTPRYYLIFEDLLETFSASKFLLLLRNPLAVLNSIIKTWVVNDWERLNDYVIDLYCAVDIFSDIIINRKSQILILHYEDLIKNPSSQLKGIFNYLNLEFEKEIIDKTFTNKRNWSFGDQNFYSQKKILKNNDKVWYKSLEDPQIWRFLYDYLISLGEKKYTILGYNYDRDLEILRQNIPADYFKDIISETQSLESVIN